MVPLQVRPQAGSSLHRCAATGETQTSPGAAVVCTRLLLTWTVQPSANPNTPQGQVGGEAQPGKQSPMWQGKVEPALLKQVPEGEPDGQPRCMARPAQRGRPGVHP